MRPQANITTLWAMLLLAVTVLPSVVAQLEESLHKIRTVKADHARTDFTQHQSKPASMKSSVRKLQAEDWVSLTLFRYACLLQRQQH